MRAAAAILAALAMAAPPIAPAVADDVVAARLWATAESARLVLETDAPLDYSVSGLANPPRLVVDLSSRRGTVAEVHNAEAEGAAAYVSGVRAARLNEETLRVVFDLSAAAYYEARRIPPAAPYRHRLVIDVKPQDSPDPLLDLARKLGAVGDPFVALIDPGHGGEDPGAVSPNGNYEKTVVLQISKRLAADINARPGMRALLTRDDDRFVPLFDRARIAQRLNVDAFLSVHADSVKSRKARGSSVFILSQKGASSKFARQLAAQENLSDLIGGAAAATADPAADIALRALTRDGKDRASRRLAELLLAEIGKVNKLHSERVESAGFAVLKSASIPSVLVETAFISNPVEERNLLDDEFQAAFVAAVGAALERYRDQYHVAD